MARKRIYYEWVIPTSVVDIVIGICADYERRCKAMRTGTVSGAVLDRYIELNASIDKALESEAEDIRRVILDDIGLERGYHFSPISHLLAKNTYYKHKRKIIHDIAVNFGLL